MSEDENADGSTEPLDSVSKANDIVAKGPLHELFGPTFKVVGTYWGEKAAEHLQKKKINNIKGHVDAVKKATNLQLDDISVRQANNLESWLKEAEQVEENDEDAALWRGILEEILTGNTQANKLIDIAKSMSKEDLLFLQHLELPSDYEENKPKLYRLVQDLIRKNLIIGKRKPVGILLVFFALGLGSIALWASISFVTSTFFYSESYRTILDYINSYFVASFCFFTLFLLVYYLRAHFKDENLFNKSFLYRISKLTPDGEKLQFLIKKYSKSSSSSSTKSEE